MVTRQLRYDIVVFDSSGRPRLVVETRKRIGASEEWAGRYFRNFLAHGSIPSTDFYLLVLPDRFFLWDLRRQPSLLPTQEAIVPAYSAPAGRLLTPYAKRIGYSLEQLSEPGFGLLVLAWLEDIVRSPLSDTDAELDQQWIVKSGLYEAIRDGRVEPEAFA